MKRLLLVLAHPDDESLGFGGTIARYASEGAEVSLITATRGQRGRFGISEEKPAPEIVGQIREQELYAATTILGIKDVTVLDYMDGELDQVNPDEIINSIAYHIRRIKPQVVLTFGPEGVYGHPDHIAISQYAAAAIVKAGESPSLITDHAPHTVSKFYHLAWTNLTSQLHQQALKELGMNVDGLRRLVVSYPDWMVSTVIDAHPFWKTVWQAVSCHETQMGTYAKLKELPDDRHRELWGAQTFYRVFSLVNGGRKKETDLFEGIKL
jgi:LmbE family N-acetylglucosaminyl deacetylase